jgi:glutamine synthetase
MAKPLAHTPGSSMHIHQSIVETGSGKNVFSDAHGEPTAMFRHFIGGQQADMADFTALFAPNVNSYQRLCHPYASPNNACWSHDNRAAGLRIPASSPVARRVENRLPGADANPYLAIAASLAAGLHGIENELEPSEAIQGEFAVPDNLALPCTLHAALERLKRSQLARELFGPEFIEGYIASKTMELTSFFDEITPWERRVLAAQA